MDASSVHLLVDPIHDIFNNPTMVTSGTLAFWLFSHSDNSTRITCPDWFDWCAGSSINFQWYEDTRRD